MLLLFLILTSLFGIEYEFRFLKGQKQVNPTGTYGTSYSSSNTPGSRVNFHTTIISNSEAVLFGGYGYGSSSCGLLNDLWTFRNTDDQWKFTGEGSSGINKYGCYEGDSRRRGIECGGCSPIRPGGRKGGIVWYRESSDYVYLYGGYSREQEDSGRKRREDEWGNGAYGYFNDLWTLKQGTNYDFRWKDGHYRVNQDGKFGTVGTFYNYNDGHPGGRSNMVGWIDKNNDAKYYIFGGYGYDDNDNKGYLNDLWIIDVSIEKYSYEKGPKLMNQEGIYGTSFSDSNYPGARAYASYWTHQSTNEAFIFAGYGYASISGVVGYLNDLWIFNIANGDFKWLTGSNEVEGTGYYQTQGVYDFSYYPGMIKSASASFNTTYDEYIVFGGEKSTDNYYSDVWMFIEDTSLDIKWKFERGNELPNNQPVYGTTNVFSPYNTPPSVYGASFFTFTDKIYFFGGYGEDIYGNSGYFNDLWEFKKTTSICYGVMSYDPTVCSGHGTCIGLDNCICDIGHGTTDPECSDWTCNGYDSSEPVGCTFEGTCVSYNNCSCAEGVIGQFCDGCEEGYTGYPDCEIAICYNIPSTSLLSCGIYGNCTSPDNCTCFEGYKGTLCDQFTCWNHDPSSFEGCNGHGVCTGHNYCDCDPGYLEDRCDDWKCDGTWKSNVHTCHSFGNCTSPNKCECSEGKIGQFCEKCEGLLYTGYPECLVPICFELPNDDPNVCDGKGYCDTPNICICNSNYYGFDCDEYLNDGYFQYNSENNPIILMVPYRFDVSKIDSDQSIDCSEVIYSVDIGKVGDNPQCRWIFDNNDKNTEYLVITLGEGFSIYVGDKLGIILNTRNQVVRIDIIEEADSDTDYTIYIIITTFIIVLIAIILLVAITLFLFYFMKRRDSLKAILKEEEENGMLVSDNMPKRMQLKSMNAKTSERSTRSTRPTNSQMADLHVYRSDMPIVKTKNDLLSKYNIPIKQIKMLEMIGEGQFQVYKAKWKKQFVAVKVFYSPLLFSEKKNYDNFEKEIKVLLTISHPNIIEFIGVTLSPPKQVGLVSEWCENGDLRKFYFRCMKESSQFISLYDKMRILYELSLAIDHIHTNDLMHRDIKCDNCLLKSDLTAKLADFGCSKTKRITSSRFTSCGTSTYMAPEVTKGEEYDEKADIFSFSIVMYEVISEEFRDPYASYKGQGESFSVPMRVANDSSFRPVFGRRLVNNNKSLVTLVKRCWNQNPIDRPSMNVVVQFLKNEKEVNEILVTKQRHYKTR